MRTLMLLILSFAISAHAADVSGHRRITIVRDLKYSKQTNVIAQKGAKWACTTELSKRVPMFAATAPALKAFDAFAKAGTKLNQAKCKDQVFFDDTSKGEKVFMACADDPAAIALLAAVGEACGRQ